MWCNTMQFHGDFCPETAPGWLCQQTRSKEQWYCAGEGVCVQASTLGSLEALLTFLKSDAVQIPVSGINIGPIHKKDVMRASVMLEKVRGRVETSLLTRLSEPHYSGSLPSLGDPDSRPLSCLVCRMCRLHMQRMTSTPGKQCISDASPAVVQGAKKFAVILAFDVPVTREARDLAESMGVRIFTADIIYHLFDQFTAYLKQVRQRCNLDGLCCMQCCHLLASCSCTTSCPERRALMWQRGPTVQETAVRPTSAMHVDTPVVPWHAQVKEEEQEAAKYDAVFPCVLKILPTCIFNKKDPIVLGVEIADGIAKVTGV